MNVKAIKEIVDFLNSEYPNNFYAFLELNESNPYWCIVCMDFDLYMSDENMSLCKQAVYEKFPEIRLIFCYMVKLFPVEARALEKYDRWKNRKLIFIK